MSKINRPPLGLQQLLGSQNFGTNPADLEGKVRPTIELLPFYGAGVLRHAQTSGARVAAGDVCSVNLTGQVALLGLSMDCYNNLTAAETLGVALSAGYIAGNGSNQKFYFTSNLETYTNPASPVVATYTFPSPLIVEEGVTLFAEYWYKSTANSISARLSVLYYDLSPDASAV